MPSQNSWPYLEQHWKANSSEDKASKARRPEPLMLFSSSFREKQLRLEAELPVGTTPVGRHHVVEGLQLKIDRQLTQLDNFANSAPPIGTVQRSLLAANQFAVMIGDVVTYQP
jgi:hypothetical protein